MRQRKPSRLLLAFVKLTGVLPALLFFLPKVHRADGAPRRLPKPCILMSNHKSLLDFVLYLILFPFRTIRFLMAEVLFNKGKAFAWFLFKIGGIFVDRDAYNFDFVGEALETLEKGQSVGVFPQGRLPVNGQSFPFKPGIVYIALRTEAPIVPVYTAGGYGFFKRAHVVIGAPIYLCEQCTCDPENPTPEELDRLTRYLEAQVDELKRQWEAGEV